MKAMRVSFVLVPVFLGALAVSGPGCRKDQAAPAPVAAVEPTPALVVSMERLFREYTSNEFAADQRFKGKVLETGGNIAEIGRDAGPVVLMLDTGNPVTQVRAVFKEDLRFKVAAMKQGEPVRIRCVCDGRSGHVQLRDCELL